MAMFGKKKPSGGEAMAPQDLRAPSTPLPSRPAAPRAGGTNLAAESGAPLPPFPRRPDPAAAAPQHQAPVAPPRRSLESDSPAEPDGKKLIVGRGIRLSGEIQACERLVVEGEVEADLADAKMLEIAHQGAFRGRATVDQAEIAGTFSGVLTVRKHLLVKNSGRIEGEIYYAQIEVERGGQLVGKIGVAGEGSPAVEQSEAPAPVRRESEAPARQEPLEELLQRS